MRRFAFRLVSIAPIAFLIACGGEDQKPPPAVPATTTATPAPIEAPSAATPAPKASMVDMQKTDLSMALDGINQHDAKKFASVYADDAVISVAGLNEVQGREAISQNMAEWFETFSKVKLGFSRVWVKGDMMAIEWVINGTHHGELFGHKGTEQPIGHYGFSIVQFSPDGKVQREARYGDLGTVMTQVGGAKAKARAVPPVPAAPETFAAKGDEDKNVDVAKALLASLENKKEADFTALLTDDIEHDGLFHLETTKGKDEAKKFYKNFTTAFPDAKFEVSRAMAVGDFVIVESMLKATHKGALGQIQPTKRPVAVHLVDVFKVKDGKVARAWTYQNSLEMQQQLGMFDVKAVNVPASQAAPAAAKPAATPAPAAPKPATPAPKK